jgi:hypothetical protein
LLTIVVLGSLFHAVFSLLPSLFFGLIFPQAMPQHESFSGRGRFLPLFFPGITAITADRGAGRHITGVALADPD